MTNLQALLTKIQKYDNGPIKDVLCDICEILENHEEWLKNIEEAISKEN